MIQKAYYFQQAASTAKISRIDEATVDIERDSRGSFSVSRPDRGWPAGRYRLEIYLDSRWAQVLRFVIE